MVYMTSGVTKHDSRCNIGKPETNFDAKRTAESCNRDGLKVSFGIYAMNQFSFNATSVAIVLQSVSLNKTAILFSGSVTQYNHQIFSNPRNGLY